MRELIGQVIAVAKASYNPSTKRQTENPQPATGEAIGVGVPQDTEFVLVENFAGNISLQACCFLLVSREHVGHMRVP